jgi:hypothetical protein
MLRAIGSGRRRGQQENDRQGRNQGEVIDYSFGTQTYQIDPSAKGYRRFVEIETGRASTIFASWRANSA